MKKNLDDDSIIDINNVNDLDKALAEGCGASDFGGDNIEEALSDCLTQPQTANKNKI